MNADDPRHGSHAGAVQHWKDGENACRPCLLAAKKQRHKADRARENGQPRLIPLGAPAYKIVCEAPRNQLAAATGMKHERLRRYEKAGPNATVNRATQERILAFQPQWTAIGIQRRLRALTRLGWSMRVIAAKQGVDADSLKRLRARREPKHVKMHIARAVLEAYERLHMTVPPAGHSASETRNEALRRGYLPPLAWQNIDDADETPRGWAYVPANRADILADLVDMGATLTDVCARLKVSREALEKWCRNHNMSATYSQLVARETSRYWVNQHGEGGAA